MKKRLLSLLLCLCVVAGLFAGLSVTAYADDGDTWVYTVQQGDYLSKICADHKIDFNANREWIVNTNKLKNPNILSVGQTLVLPKEGKVLKYVAPTTTTTTTPTATTTGTVVTPTTTTTTYTGGASTIQYTLKSGDTVLKVCQTLGIDFHKNYDWITTANNITNYNNLKVGRVLTLPAPGTTPALNTATPTTTTGTVTTGTAVATTGTTLAGDTVQYYLIDYVVKSGDTLYNICNYYGANSATVQSLNGITNAARLTVGQKLSIPSMSAPTSGTYTKVIAHKVVSGDTVDALCRTYGISYAANANKISALNNNINLAAIKVGQTLLFPVSGSAGGSGGGSSVVPGQGGSVTPGAAGNTYYTLNKTGSVNGTYSLTVNGQSVNGAVNNQTVHVVATPDHYYSLDKITVTRTSNGANIPVDANNNFVMPASDVQIVVTFKYDETKTPHNIINYENSQLSVTPVVNGYTNYQAEPGQSVSLIFDKLPSGKVISKIMVSTVKPNSLEEVINNKINSNYLVSVSSNFTFSMPAYNVYVTVVLKDA